MQRTWPGLSKLGASQGVWLIDILRSFQSGGLISSQDKYDAAVSQGSEVMSLAPINESEPIHTRDRMSENDVNLNASVFLSATSALGRDTR